jgi:hypothetical protein
MPLLHLHQNINPIPPRWGGGGDLMNSSSGQYSNLTTMARRTIINNKECPETLQELIDELKKPDGRYQHLKIIHNREANKFKMELGQRFLFINDDAFGIFYLLDFSYANGKLKLTLKENFADKIVHASINIKDKHAKFHLINWEDIKNMVFEDEIIQGNEEELLELDYDVTHE